MTRLRSEVGHSVTDLFVHPRREALNISAPTVQAAVISLEGPLANGG